MAYKPVSGLPVQYSTINNVLASGYYLKFYEADSSTALSMATDASGTTPLAYCKLSTSGLPISDPDNNESDFIPHLNQPYKSVLYPTETDAINNTNGVRTISNIDLGETEVDEITFPSPATAGTVKVIKAGSAVTVTMTSALVHPSSTSEIFSTLIPSGYRPVTTQATGFIHSDAATHVRIIINSSGDFIVAYFNGDLTGSTAKLGTGYSTSITYEVS